MRLFTRFLTLLAAVLALPYSGAFAASMRVHSSVAVVAKAAAVSGQGIGAVTLSVYPNPGHGLVSIQLNAPVSQDNIYKFRLNNVLGREMRLLTLHPDLAAEGLALDVSNLPAGMYFYSLLVNDHVVSTNRLTLQ